MRTVNTVREGGCLEIILSLPESRNALEEALFDDFALALEEASAPEVRAVLFRGEGKAFCVGGNVKIFADIAESGGFIPVEGPDKLHAMLTGLRELEKPVVAAVQGACAGAGVSLMLACDLVFAAEDAKFFMAYLSVGLSPDGGSTHFLPRHVGLKKAMELFLSPQPIGAQEALDLGLVNKLVPESELVATSRQMTQMLSMGPTAAIAKLKKLFNATGHQSMQEQLDMEARFFSESSKTADFREGAKAFIEKRMPVFQGK